MTKELPKAFQDGFRDARTIIIATLEMDRAGLDKLAEGYYIRNEILTSVINRLKQVPVPRHVR